MCKSWSFYSCTFLVGKSGILIRTGHIVGTMKLSKFSSSSFNLRVESFGGHLRVLRSRKSNNVTKWSFCSIVYAIQTFYLQILKVQIGFVGKCQEENVENLTFKICQLNVFMAYAIQQKLHLVISLLFRDHRTRKSPPNFPN